MVEVVVFGVSAARAVGVTVRVGAGGGGGVDFDVGEGVDFDVEMGGGEEEEEEEEEMGLVVVSRESEVGIEDSGDEEDGDGEYIMEGRIVAFATASGVDIVCIVVDGSCAYICVLALYAAVGQKHWHWQAAFPEPAPAPPAVADGRTVVRAVAVFVPVAARVVAEEETVPLILIAVSLNI